MFDILIRNGYLVDGTGRPGYHADLGIVGSRIAAIGALAASEAHTVIDASRLVVSPGFIDIHQHSDFTLLVNRRADSMLRQGVTTAVTGVCGHCPAPVRDPDLIKLNLIGYDPGWGVEIGWRTFGQYLEHLGRGGLALNVLPLVGHGALRLAAMGFDARPAGPAELALMGALLSQAIEEGAAGISWGLEYSPGRHADRTEMDALSRIVARHSGLYSIHIRNRAEQMLAATDEAVSIAERAGLPVQLSHFAPRPYVPAGQFERALLRAEEAGRRGVRVGLDVFPRLWAIAMVAALLPPSVCAGSPPQVLARLRAPATREVVRAYWDEGQNYLLRAGGPEGIVVTYAPHSPDVVGLNFVQIAAGRQVTMADAACDILLAEGDNLYNALITHVFATRPHLDELISQPNCAIMSDGVASAPYGPLAGLRTTRDSYGYTAAFLQEYVRQRKIFSLEEAIRRMTSLPATLCDISDRGRLAEHAAADIVVFDLAEIRDVTTDLDLIGHPEGIEWVIVNGEIVVARREHTGRLPGSLL